MSNGLPNGWEMQIDPSTGRSFYVNHDTLETSWTPPMETPLPEGWSQQRDGEGRIFFIDHVNQKTQWEDPRLAFEPVSYPSSAIASSNQVSNSTSESSSMWTCDKCTFAENPLSSRACEVCEAPRDGNQNFSTSVGGGDDTIDAETAAAIAAAQASWDIEERITDKVTEPSELSPFNVPDDSSAICTLCGSIFDWKNRRHHCKCCGGLLCNACSDRKVNLSFIKAGESRVCNLCYDHQSAGDRNCYLRYIGILRDADDPSPSDRLMALKGIANMFEKLPDAMHDSASINDQAFALRMFDAIARWGGISTLCMFLNPKDPSDIQEESAHIVSLVATAAACSTFDSQNQLSRVQLCSELSAGSMGMVAIKKMLSSSSRNTPYMAHVHLCHALYLLGDLFEIQESVRKSDILPALCDHLLAQEEELQISATMAVARLITGNGDNVEAMLASNGMQSLILLLGSSNFTIQEHAAYAINSGLKLAEIDPSGKGQSRAKLVLDALVNLGGVSAAIKLVANSPAPSVIAAGLTLLGFLSDEHGGMVTDSVPQIVNILSNPNSEHRVVCAHILSNVARYSPNLVIDSGALGQCVQLLQDPQAQSYAASTCAVCSTIPEGAGVIIDNSGIPVLVNILKTQISSSAGGSAGIVLANMMSQDQNKQSVISSGGVEALLSLQNRSDRESVCALVRGIYSFVNDVDLLRVLLHRIPPPTLATRLLEILRQQNILDDASTEMLILTLAILCGINETVPPEQARGAQEIVATVGTSLLLPLLSNGYQKPAVVLAVFRVLLTISRDPQFISRITKVNGVSAVVRALTDSLQAAPDSAASAELVSDLRLHGIELFANLASTGTVSPNDVRMGLRAIQGILTEGHRTYSISYEDIKIAALRAIKELSKNANNLQHIAEICLTPLIDIVLTGRPDRHLFVDLCDIFSLVAVGEDYAKMLLDAGIVHSMVSNLDDTDPLIVASSLKTLTSISKSSKHCRSAMVNQNIAGRLLSLGEHGAEDVSIEALACLETLCHDQSNCPKVASESGVMESLLRLMKHSQHEIVAQVMAILLLVAKDSDDVWEKIVVHADVDTAISLLKNGPLRVQGHASATIAALCKESPGYALASSSVVLEVIPHIVGLLTKELDTDKNGEIPAADAAHAVTILAESDSARDSLLDAGCINALVTVLLKERRLGRPKSRSSEYAVQAIYMLTRAMNVDDEMEQFAQFWHSVAQQRRDLLDALILVLDAQARAGPTQPTASGVLQTDIVKYCVIVINSVSLESLTSNEITLLGRATRPLMLTLDVESPPPELIDACLQMLHHWSSCAGLIPVLVGAGGIRSLSKILDPVLEESCRVPVDVVLLAAETISTLVQESKSKAVDDAMNGTKAIPALCALVSRSEELFGANNAQRVQECGLQAVSSLARGGGVSIQKSLVTCNITPALLQVAEQFANDPKGASNALAALGRMAVIGDHRMSIISAEPSVVNVCRDIFANESSAPNLRVSCAMLLGTLGPTIADLVPDLLGPLTNMLQSTDPEIASCRSSVLASLSAWTLQSSIADEMLASASYDIVNVLNEGSISELEEDISRSEIILHLSRGPRARIVSQKFFYWCTNVLTTGALDEPERSIIYVNALMTLCNFTVDNHSREMLLQNRALLKSVSRVASSAETDFAVTQIANKFFILAGHGESIVKQKRAVTKLPPPPPPPPPPMVPPALTAMNNGTDHASPPPVPSPMNASPPLPQKHVTISQPHELPRKPSASKVLPTYSNVVPSLQPAGGSDRASLELAMKLQAQESPRMSQPNKATPPVSSQVNQPWACDACTFENTPRATHCEMCGGVRKNRPSFTSQPSPPMYQNSMSQSNMVSIPCSGCGVTLTGPSNAENISCPHCRTSNPTRSSNNPSMAGKIYVKCPNCRATLAAPESAQMFMCMSCRTTHSTQSNRI